MAVIVENAHMGAGFFSMRLGGVERGVPGQFLMLKTSSLSDPFLPRPISICDQDGVTTRLVYQVVGRGTELMSRLRPSDEIEVTGPLGNGFPLSGGGAVLIGGGAGAAPLVYLARELRRIEPGRAIDTYLGFRGDAMLEDELKAFSDSVSVNIGGYVTDDIAFAKERTYYACGPEPMLRAAARKAGECGATLYVSLEKHMACGVGACLVCSCKTRLGNLRVCKDGPVFEAGEVYYE